jgi:IS30 family transposase
MELRDNKVTEVRAMGQGQDTTGEKKWKQLSEKERYKIETLAGRGLSSVEIGKELGRDRRTIEREIMRGLTEQRDYLWRERHVYCADVGQRKHEEAAGNKGRGLKIGHDHKLAEHIERRIVEERYSPDAVIGEIKAKGLRFETTICTKTVYNMIDAGIFLRLSNKDLPVKKEGKKRTYKRVRKVALNNTKGRSIEERPREIENREESGHWEMDCVTGSGKACLLVMTERRSRRQLIFKIPEKTQRCVRAVINRLERKYKGKFKEEFRSITMDNGSEFLDQEGLESSCLKSGGRRTTCYYAHPYSAYERGSNEAANRLVRRFVPKGSNIGTYTDRDIHRLEHWMNNYPRRIFGYKTANDMAA